MGIIGEITKEYLESLRFVQEVKREVVLPDTTTDIVAIVGARRVGKTFLMLQKAREILSRNEQVIYVSMDEPKFKEMEVRRFAELIREEYPKGKVYLFLDEVQEW